MSNFINSPHPRPRKNTGFKHYGRTHLEKELNKLIQRLPPDCFERDSKFLSALYCAVADWRTLFKKRLSNQEILIWVQEALNVEGEWLQKISKLRVATKESEQEVAFTLLTRIVSHHEHHMEWSRDPRSLSQLRRPLPKLARMVGLIRQELEELHHLDRRALKSLLKAEEISTPKSAYGDPL